MFTVLSQFSLESVQFIQIDPSGVCVDFPQTFLHLWLLCSKRLTEQALGVQTLLSLKKGLALDHLLGNDF